MRILDQEESGANDQIIGNFPYGATVVIRAYTLGVAAGVSMRQEAGELPHQTH